MSKARTLVRGEGADEGAAPEPAAASPWTGPTAVALVILAAFGVAAVFVWKKPVPTLVFAAAAFALAAPLWFVQRSRALRTIQDPDPGVLGEEPVLRGLLGLVGGSAGERLRRDGRSAEVRREMFAPGTAGRVQSALLASLAALVTAGVLAGAAFWKP